MTNRSKSSSAISRAQERADQACTVYRTGKRVVMGAAGAALVVFGLRRGGAKGFTAAAIGGRLIYRGLRGHTEVMDLVFD